MPNHPPTEQAIDDAGYLLSSYDRHDVAEVNDVLTTLFDQFGDPADTNRYLVLGSYDEDKIELLWDACALIEDEDPNARAILLSELNVEDKSWDNFYLKFKYTQTVMDHFVVVAEDNDGGHELELEDHHADAVYECPR